MKKISVIFSVIVFLLLSCVVPVTTNPGIEFVPGQLMVGLRNTTSFIEFSDHIFSFEDFSVQSSSSIAFRANQPQDSVAAILERVHDKNYLFSNSSSVFYSQSDLEMKMIVTFDDATESQIEDFNDFCTSYGFTRDTLWSAFTDFFVLHVPIGNELGWKNILSDDNFFLWVDVNAIGTRCE
jgi:hypothetical protein